MAKANILLVDDDLDTRKIIPRILSRAGFDVTASDSAMEALRLLMNANFDLLLSDIRMPVMDGIALLKEVKAKYPDLPVVLITGFATIESAIKAIREGAEEYITKPYTEDELVITIERVAEKTRLLDENRLLQQEIASKYHLGSIVGVSPAMQRIYALTEKASHSMANVVIYGETGTGKELVARAIHYNSPRADKPFVGINCGAIPETLFESELFGYAKGAFTGATRDKKGLFEAANEGTIFLDEIGDLGLAVQIKLLRAIEDREIRRIGEIKSRHVDVRIITATHRDLGDLVKENRFREDLFYRLQVIPIYLPPLRLRRGDIPLLLEYFRGKYNQEAGKSIMGFSAKCMDYLMSYNWPGNVRELENFIQQAVALVDQPVITHVHLPPQFKGDDTEPTITTGGFLSLSELERQHIIHVLRSVRGNHTKAARTLGIRRKTLYGKIKHHNITDAERAIEES